MKKKIIIFSFCFIVCLIAGMGKAKNTQAGTVYQSVNASLDTSKKERTVGDTTFLVKAYADGSNDVLYAIKNGKKNMLLSKEDLKVEIVTNGETVYCIGAGWQEWFIYQVSCSGGEASVFSIENSMINYSSCQLAGYYRGRVFILAHRKGLYSYDMKSGKMKKVAPMKGGMLGDEGSARQYGKYIYLDRVSLGWLLRVYNAQNGKVKTICKRTPYYDLIDGNVYYLDLLKKNPDGGQTPGMGIYYVVSLKKCRLDGSGKKTLAKGLRVQTWMPIKFTKHSITYYNQSNVKVTRKF